MENIDNDKTCSVCCEDYTKVRRAKIECPFPECNSKICIQCIKYFITSEKNEAICMMCKNPYERRFITDNFNSTFLKDTLKKHEKKLIVDSEMSKMLDTQKHVQEYLEEKKFIEMRDKLMKEEQELIRQIRKKTQEEIQKLGFEKKNKQRESVIFKYPCPMENCRGFVSIKGNCGTCECKVCTNCNQIKDVDHQCNPDDVASFELIKKETKPCPKCGERIQKISGCDQMWCTAEKEKGKPCGCTFSWSTGKIEKGNIHNPHFYQWVQKNGGQIRNPGDVVCGGIMNYQIFRARINQNRELNKIIPTNPEFKLYSKDFVFRNRNLKPSVLSVITDFHRAILDLGYRIQDFRRIARNNQDNLQLRIQYSVKEITKENFEKNVMKRHTEKVKYTELLKIFELYNTVGIEQINSINDDNSTDNILKICDTAFNLKNYINSEFEKISKGFTGRPFRLNSRFFLSRN